jgi:IS5 family transposase
MIADFDDFCLRMFVLIDDLWPQIAPRVHRPGPKPDCSDSELITMALVGECRGWDEETVLIANWNERRHLFPIVPDRTRYNRRRGNLALAINLLRQLVLRDLDLAQDGQLVIDSLPLPVVGFHLAPGAKGDWDEHEASYGRCASKKQTIYGYKLHLLMTLSGVIVDFSLAPANESDLAVGADMMRELYQRTVIGDKGYISKLLREELAAQQVALLTPTKRNQKEQLPKAAAKRLNGARQIVECVNSQLAQQFHIERNHASSFRGLVARLYTKLTAHTLCIKLNRLLGNPDFLQIKGLAYPV